MRMAVAALILAAVPVALLAGGGGGDDPRDRHRWKPPKLSDPVTVQITNENSKLKLDPARDYRLEMPKAPLRAPGGLVVNGGRNVVLDGGVIRIGWQGKSPTSHQRRGLFLVGQTGTIHVEDLRITGPDLGEGINLDERRGATVQLVDIRVDRIRARDERHFSDSHPDLLQTWAGPRRLRIDGFRGVTGYQGFFLLPMQFDRRQRPREVSLRDVSITGVHRSAYLLWTSGDFPIRLRDVRLRSPRRGPLMWPNRSAWRGVVVRSQ